jgi:hypothetical protein
MLVWAVVAFRQIGSRFFLFFLLLAFEDPIAYLLSDLFNFTSIDTYIYFDLARFLSLFRKEDIIENRFIFGLAFGFILLLHFIFDGSLNDVLLNAIIHFAILLKLLEIFTKDISFRKIISFFLLVLIFYQIITVTKIVNTLSQFSDAYYYFMVSTSFQVLIGIFFIIFREKDARMKYQLR